MAALARERGVLLRPHAKTHKTPLIARMQLERGALGFCCAKLGEAEVMAGEGIEDILITTEIVGHRKIERLISLARKAKVAVDVNDGQNRTGVAPGEPAAGLAAAIASEPGLTFAGLQGYEGHLQHIRHVGERKAASARAMQALIETAQRIERRGLRVERLTTAGTGTASYVDAAGYRLEIQPGSYAMMDAQYGAVEGVDFEHALTVLTTVISVHADRVVVDAGLKACSTDAGMPKPVGLEASYLPGGDEHGLLSGPAKFFVGMQLELIPGHCDTTINLHDEYVVRRGGEVIGHWPIAARGRVR